MTEGLRVGRRSRVGRLPEVLVSETGAASGARSVARRLRGRRLGGEAAASSEEGYSSRAEGFRLLDCCSKGFELKGVEVAEKPVC